MLRLDLTELIEQQIEVQLGNTLNTSMPAKIISYNAATNRAIVKPDLPKRLASGEALESPQVVEVPVLFPASGGGKASMTFPLKPGDGVMLVIQQRSLEGWLDGKNTMPDDPRQFDLSDSVAIAGCQPSGIVGDPDNVVLKFDKASMILTKDNNIIHKATEGSYTVDSPSITFGNSSGSRSMMGSVGFFNTDVTLAHDPVLPMQAATKEYVDSRFHGGGGGGGGGDQPANGALIGIGATPPSDPTAGTFWFDTEAAQTYIWYNDYTSAQWVPVIATPYLSTNGGEMNGILLLAGDPVSPLEAATKEYVDNAVQGGGSNIGDAPSNSLSYGRMNNSWIRVLAITGDVMDGGNF
jgi:hypothetical protein